MMNCKNVVWWIFFVAIIGILSTSGCLEDDEGAETTSGLPETPIKYGEIDFTPSSIIPQDYYSFGVEDIDFIELYEDLPEWFDAASFRGVDVISFAPMGLDGTVMIDSPTLLDAGFKPDPDAGFIFPEILQEAKKHDMKIIIMLETIGHINDNIIPYSKNIKVSKLTPDAVQEIITEITKEAREYGMEIAFDEEAFGDDYINPIRESTTQNGVEYFHFFEDLNCRADGYISEDFSYYPQDARNDPDDRKYIISLLDMGSYYGQLGFLDIMYGAAKACGKPSATLIAGGWGMGPKTHQNIALMRAVQYDSKLYMFVIAEGENGVILEEEELYVVDYNFKENLLPLLWEFAKKPDDKPKPLANIVIDQSVSGEDVIDLTFNSELSSISAITNSMHAAGYDIVVTKSRPYPDASLYYVLSSGLIFDEGDDLPVELAELVDGDVPIFYQVAGELPDKPNWNRVTTKLDIKDNFEVVANVEEESILDPIPENVSYTLPDGDAELKYGGYTFETDNLEMVGKVSLGHYLHYIDPTAINSETLLEGYTAKDEDEKFDDRTALIIKKDNVYFLNGGYLHMGITPILTNIIADEVVYNSPSYGYFTNGESRSVFYAPYNVNIDVNVLGGSRVTEFDEEGNRLPSSGVELDGNRLHGSVERFHLVIVD